MALSDKNQIKERDLKEQPAAETGGNTHHESITDTSGNTTDLRAAFGSNKKQVRKLAHLAMLFALALVFSWFESLIPPIIPIPVKYGLSNIPVMFTLMSYGLPSALLLAFFKSAFVLMTRGSLAAVLSLSGGIVSVLVMWLLDRAFRGNLSFILLSVMGALAHNLAQFSVVLLVFPSGATAVFYGLLPPLLFMGIFSGILTGIALRIVLPFLSKVPEI